MQKPTFEQIVLAIKSIGGVVFTTNYSVNLGAVRTSDNESNTFNDWIYAFYYLDGKIVGEIVPGTTDPGLYYRINPMKRVGTAILVHDRQYRGVYQLQDPKLDSSLRGHKGRKAFRQIKEMAYWRDDNRDKYLDFGGDVEISISNTNLHYMGTLGKQVNKWSAGCPGAAEKELDKIFAIGDKQIEMGLGDKFSFTLLSEKGF